MNEPEILYQSARVLLRREADYLDTAKCRTVIYLADKDPQGQTYFRNEACVRDNDGGYSRVLRALIAELKEKA
jgi:hypothetical protein